MDNKSLQENRPPVVTIMGHVDHGKSTLLDYIRKTNIVDEEIGGITQKISAYEVSREVRDSSGKTIKSKITFIDTPGHAAFSGMRQRGANTADIAILIVSSEDGVKPQTIEAYKQIKSANVPFIVALTKIDKPTANVERAKISLAENEIYLEGYGGDISFIPISSITGEGVDDLLDLIILTAEVADLKGDKSLSATGAIVEVNRDSKKGISAMAVIKNGSLKTGMFIACGKSFAPIRIVEDYSGKKITEATFSSPIRVFGWNIAPKVGNKFVCLSSKKDLEKYIESVSEKEETGIENEKNNNEINNEQSNIKKIVPIIIKADVLGSAEAISNEIKKLGNDKIGIKVIHSSIGDITESDIKIAGNGSDVIVLGFNVKADNQAKAMIERLGITHETFNIIYKLIEWLESRLVELTPKIMQEEILGKAKIMKFFSSIRDKQIIGGKVIDKEINLGHKVKISRRETVIGEGLIRELQQAKTKTSSVKEGFEFGAMIESKIELAPGDVIEDITMIEK